MRNWADLDGEVLVYLPSNLAAVVAEDDVVTVTGTVKPLERADIERDLRWLDSDVEMGEGFEQRPVIITNKIVGGN